MSASGPGRHSDRLTDLVSNEWPNWFGETSLPELGWVLESTARPIAQTAVILYGVDATSGRPMLVAKASRDPRFGFMTNMESERIAEARAVLGPEARVAIPRSLGVASVDRDDYLISEYVPAGPSWESLGGAKRALIVDRLSAWLADLHAQTERPAGSQDSGHPELIAKTYIEVFQPSDMVIGRIKLATEAVEAELASESTEVLVHGDFWPGNWRIDGDRFAVIDWENSHWSTSPLLDEFLFPLSEVSRGLSPAGDDLMWFSDIYRRHRDLPARPRDDDRLVPIWVAAEVATRTQRRWGVVEDWTVDWHLLVTDLAASL